MQMTKESIAAILLLTLCLGSASAQSGYDLYQKALVKERAEGNLHEAIVLYQRVVSEHAANRQLAAKAQYRIGVLYDRLGRKVDAQRAYQTVVSQYSDQPSETRQAHVKLGGIPMAGELPLQQVLACVQKSGSWKASFHP